VLKRPSANKERVPGREAHLRVMEKRRNPVQIASDSCVKIKDLGFTTSMHIKMYGELFEIISDPFSEGDFIAVRATSGNDPEIRTVRLPVAILIGRADRFLKRPNGTSALKLVVGALPSTQSLEQVVTKAG
jgi:hypothetical protein